MVNAVFSLILLTAAALAQHVSIGSGLSDGLALVYQSGGVAQAPWVYDSVRVVEREGFERCVRVARRDQPVRETCLRDNTLFEPTDAGQPRAMRPIGPGMRLEVPTASGQVMLYETGNLTSRRVAETVDVVFLPTTITTRDKDGVLVRRLREEYAPALLTALRGEFEEPDGNGGWKKVREFSLSEIRQPLRVQRLAGRQLPCAITPSRFDTASVEFRRSVLAFAVPVASALERRRAQCAHSQPATLSTFWSAAPIDFL